MERGDAGRPRLRFILSTGRSGSLMLAQALGTHPAIDAHHEPPPHLNIEAFRRWKGDIDPALLQARIQRKRGALIDRARAAGRLYVESSHYMSHLIDELEELYRPLFIHVHRDGRDFVRSGLQRSSWYRRPGPIEAAIGFLQRRWLIDLGSSWRHHRLEPPPAARSRFEKVCWLWAEINRVILARLERVPGERRMTLPVASLDGAAFRSISSFLGAPLDEAAERRMLEVSASRPHRSSSYEVPAKEEWGAAERAAFAAWAGEVMGRLGYGV